MSTYRLNKDGEYVLEEKKRNLFTIIKDECEYYFKCVKDFHYSFKTVIHNIFSKENRGLLKSVLTGHNWDRDFLTELEYEKIKQMLSYYEKALYIRRRNTGEQHNEVTEPFEISVKTLRLCKRLLEIIHYEEGLYTFTGDTEMKFYELEEGNTYRMEFNGVYTPLVKVNTKNIKRFVKNAKTLDFYKKNVHELYLLKAKHLYYLIREYYTDYWWE